MVALRCRCGAVQGRVADASPRTVNRVICYCDDCQAFAHHLGRRDLLDAHGGSDIAQVAPAALTFQQGHDRIAGVRLTRKGLLRWHATCCNTPLGNTVGPAIPFVGIVTHALHANSGTIDQACGPPRAAIKGEFAIGVVPTGSKGIPFRIVLRAMTNILRWRLSGRAWPNPYFDRTSGRPIHPVTVLSPEQRDALRPLCGPKPGI